MKKYRDRGLKTLGALMAKVGQVNTEQVEEQGFREEDLLTWAEILSDASDTVLATVRNDVEAHARRAGLISKQCVELATWALKLAEIASAEEDL